MVETPPDARHLIHHVAERLGDLGAPVETALEQLSAALHEPVTHARGVDLTVHLARSPQIVVSGWACQMRPDVKRGRQIFGFLVPGDVIGSFWRPPPYAFWRLTALTRLVTLPAGRLLSRDAQGRFVHPDVVTAARRAEDLTHRLLVDHIVRLGARDAYAGLAHLLLELHARLARVGQAQDGVFRLPVGQRILAQTTGFSVAHTNQTLQRMTADGLFSIEGDVVRLLKADRMAQLARFADGGMHVLSLDSPDAVGALRERDENPVTVN